MEITTRKDAKAKGLTRYFTGTPCKRGHVAERATSNGECVTCAAARTKGRYGRAPEKYRAWRAANIETARAATRAWSAANLVKRAAYESSRRANKLKATPPWLTQEQIRRMATKYVEAKRYEAVSDINWHVDHVVPLRGERVCGLHVPWNLQVIPAVENQAKHNKLLEAA